MVLHAISAVYETNTLYGETLNEIMLCFAFGKAIRN